VIITQIYGLDQYDHAKLEVCLSREDVEQLKSCWDFGFFDPSGQFLEDMLDAIITEAEKCR
jgi:hypothetical protein